jgi:hypothetical protein
MLPVYHRSYDARLLLLAVPASAMLWRERGRVRWCAVFVTGLAILCTGDLFVAVMLMLIKNTGSLPGIVMTVIQVFPAPLSLLAAGVFYLWIYLRQFLAARVNPQIDP